MAKWNFATGWILRHSLYRSCSWRRCRKRRSKAEDWWLFLPMTKNLRHRNNAVCSARVCSTGAKPKRNLSSSQVRKEFAPAENLRLD